MTAWLHKVKYCFTKVSWNKSCKYGSKNIFWILRWLSNLTNLQFLRPALRQGRYAATQVFAEWASRGQHKSGAARLFRTMLTLLLLILGLFSLEARLFRANLSIGLKRKNTSRSPPQNGSMNRGIACTKRVQKICELRLVVNTCL